MAEGRHGRPDGQSIATARSGEAAGCSNRAATLHSRGATLPARVASPLTLVPHRHHTESIDTHPVPHRHSTCAASKLTPRASTLTLRASTLTLCRIDAYPESIDTRSES